MRTTINLDEELIDEAQRVTGTKERTALIHQGLRALIARESARRLVRLGGSDPRAKAPSRRRPSWFSSTPRSGAITFTKRATLLWARSNRSRCSCIPSSSASSPAAAW